MQQKEKQLIVVSLIEGRNFPNRPRCHLVTEAKFDGELLCSDPVPHKANPEINQELAWELDRKGLQQHRLQRSSIKLVLYAVDSASPVKETVGYVLLDVRSVSENKLVKWFPILHSKYAKLRPQLAVTMYLDNGSADDVIYEDSAPPPKSALASSVDPQTVKAVLRSDHLGGFYQIGSEKLCREAFVFSVSLLCAGNLFSLFPASIQLPASNSQSGFHFHYSIFGNSVNSESFGDLVCSEFPAERSSLRIRSTPDMLRVYFANIESNVILQLVCGRKSIGQCSIPLYELLTTGNNPTGDVHWNNSLHEPSVVEGVFLLEPENTANNATGDNHEDLEHDIDKPWVAVSVVLRRGSCPPPPPSNRMIDLLQSRMSTIKPPIPTSSHQQQQQQQQFRPMLPTSITNSHPMETLSSKNVNWISSGSGVGGGGSLSHSVNNINNEYGEDEEIRTITESKIMKRSSSLNTIASSKLHKFCFTIELRSIRNVAPATHTLSIYARYVYPLFGSAAPIITHPPVEIRRNQEVALPQGFCAFEFAADEEVMKSQLEKRPLIVEIYTREKAKNEDTLVGSAQLNLSSVFNAKLTLQNSRDTLVSPASGGHKEPTTKVTRRTLSGVAIVENHADNYDHPPPRETTDNSAASPSPPTPTTTKVGELTYQLIIEDYGELTMMMSNSPTLVRSQSALRMSSNDTSSRDAEGNSYSNKRQSSPIVVTAATTSTTATTNMNHQDARQSLEYRAAMELELWKENQEEIFRNDLKEKEKSHMLALSEEWSRRDKEREIITKRKIAEYDELSQTLQATIRDLTTRERRLEQAEADLARQRQEASREHSSVLAELRAASQRVHNESEHKVSMEKERTQHWKQRAEEWQMKWQQLDKEFSRYRERQEHSTESKLQAEMAQLKLENIEMEKRLDEAVKSKLHYKDLWAKALKELTKMKLRTEELSREQIKRQEMQLEHMRLRYLSTEEAALRGGGGAGGIDSCNNNSSNTHKEIEGIKRELDEIREEAKKNQDKELASTLMNGEMSEHLARLIEERDALLRTGVYSLQDEPICELDREIRRCIAASNNDSSRT